MGILWSCVMGILYAVLPWLLLIAAVYIVDEYKGRAK